MGKFKLFDSYKDGAAEFDRVELEFYKAARWMPKYERRPQRPVFYLGIDSAVPLIERESQTSRIHFVERLLAGNSIVSILQRTSDVFNRNYAKLFEINRSGKKHNAFSSNGLKYSELTMGAGEQRAFKILAIALNAPKYSLILIDEIDLLLHQFALTKLITALKNIADSRRLQIVFTTHNQHVAKMNNVIKVLHLHNTDEKTLLLKDTNIEAMYRLSGFIEDLRMFEIYVEDFVSLKIVEDLLSEKGIKKHVKIIQYGAAINAYTVAAGCMLKEKSLDRKYFILDGDVECGSEMVIKGHISSVLTGNVEPHIGYRNEVYCHIIKYNSIRNMSPEGYLSGAIKELNDGELDESGQLIKSVEYQNDKHQYICCIESVLDTSKEQSIIHFISNAKRNTEKWDSFVAPVRNAIDIFCQKLGELNTN